MTTQQQTERERLADLLEIAWQRFQVGTVKSKDLAVLIEAAALLRGDEPAKPDRYVEVAREFLAAWGERVLAVDQGEYDGDKRFQAAAAVLRRHFEPSVEVLKAAGKVESITNSCAKNTFCSSARTLADFILKGDQ